MQSILINVKSQSKVNFLMELLSQFDFIEIKQPVTKTKLMDINFIKTVGLWKDREYNVENMFVI